MKGYRYARSNCAYPPWCCELHESVRSTSASSWSGTPIGCYRPCATDRPQNVHYTYQIGVDEDYRSVMAMRRNEQTDLLYIQEYNFYLQRWFPIYNRTLIHPVHPVTNLHYAHVLARNLRPLIEQAALDLENLVKCDTFVIPICAIIDNYTPFIQLASELAECGSIGYHQIRNLYNAVAWAYDLALADSQDRGFDPSKWVFGFRSYSK